jgi:uncharacterized protein
MGGAEFSELSDILDELRTRFDETPQWEFCEGFIAALICCRRVIEPSEYLAVLLDSDDEIESPFSDPTQAQRFTDLWQRRWREVAMDLDAEVDSLNDERTYRPEVMDLRGLVLQLSDEERATLSDEPVPSFAQIWAIGFMYVVENWPEEWTLPRDKEAAGLIDEALQALIELTEDDTDPPAISMFSEDAPPSVSKARMEAFGDALWAVYDLHDVWRSIGPRVEQIRKVAEPGRNDPCPCGSGKKYKKCHGAN